MLSRQRTQPGSAAGVRLRAAWLLLALWLAVAALPVGAAQLAAGSARVAFDIPLNLPMAGYSARQGNSQGVLDPLHAKVLVLEGSNQSVALVTMDLAGVFPETQLEQLRKRVKASTGIADVIVNASHTHSGPFLKMDAPDEWQKKVIEDIGAAVEKAWKGRVPARVGVGRGSVAIGHNRLFYMSRGQGKMFWRNETKIPTSPVDTTVLVLRVDRAQDGSTLAVLVNYACHPVVLGPANLHYSADYPGEMMRAVEAVYPGAQAMFLQGAAGDINPYFDKTPPAENGVQLMRETGRTLANEVLRVAKAIETTAPTNTEMHLSRDTLEFQTRWNKEKVMARLANVKLSDFMKMRLSRMFQTPVQAPVTVLLLGREFALVGVPGEIFTNYQLDIRRRVPDFPILFAGYTNGGIGYIPTIQAAVDGGYGASEVSTFVEVGAGNRMIDKAVIRLGYWTGKLKTRPAQ